MKKFLEKLGEKFWVRHDRGRVYFSDASFALLVVLVVVIVFGPVLVYIFVSR